MRFGVLRYPHANKRYFDSTRMLLKCEFEIIVNAVGIQVINMGYETIGGVELFCFETDCEVNKIKPYLHRLSSNFVLFQIKEKQLVPLNEGKETYFKEDLSSILKYSGKTNEDFTAMMINIAVFSSKFDRSFQKPLQVLDPMCGRGTTLYQGLIMGYNVAGVEIEQKSCSEIDKYLKRYLKYHKYKHEASHQTIVQNKKKKGMKYTIETADTVEHYKKKDRRTVQFACGNTLDVNTFYKKDSFHTIVTDIPYGVQHSGTSKEKPVEMVGLLRKAAVAWKVVLKKGGTVVISYNAYTLSRETLKEIFEEAGYEVLTGGPYDAMEHWVEQAVNRDVFVARK